MGEPLVLLLHYISGVFDNTICEIELLPPTPAPSGSMERSATPVYLLLAMGYSLNWLR
jgi:hypothetical protein